MSKIRWGVISTANIATWRVIPAMRKSHNGEVIAVASRSYEKARAFADEQQIPLAFGSYEELIDSPDVDAVYIPLPNRLHKEWSIRSAEAGKPTLCEKPLAGTADDAQAIVDAFRSRNVPLAEAFMYRFHPRTVRSKQLLDEGAIGELHLIDADFSFKIRRKNDIRLQSGLDGGSLRDVGVYCVNLMRLMTGEEPTVVRALGQIVEDTDVDEWAAGLLKFPSGVLGHFGCGLRSQRVHGYRLRGSEGSIEVRDGFGPEGDQRTSIHLKQRHGENTD